MVWHGWLLEGSGSNVYAARVAEVWRRAGHEVVLLCQEPRPERFAFVDAWGTVGEEGVSDLLPTEAEPAAGRVVLLRPRIGELLPVFVYDEYEGFRVVRFVDLTEDELGGYLDANVAAVRAAAAWLPPDAAVVGHAIPGPAIAARALGAGRFVAKVHGSDVEYALREQERYVALAREGLGASRVVCGGSRDVLARAAALVPEIAGRTRVIPPGVNVERWVPRPRADVLAAAAAHLDRDPETEAGRSASTDDAVREALAARDGERLDELARGYDQAVPDPDAAARLRALAGDAPVVGYLGKLIPQKGVERLIEALVLQEPSARGLVVGFGTFREWLVALVSALDAGDVEGARWLGTSSPMQLELGREEAAAARGLAARITFTGRLDHRFAPEAVAAMDALAVPSILEEAFGMVAAEAAAAGALPVVARHSALAEVADALEGAVGAPGALSFEPGPGATRRLAERLRGLLSLPPEERARYRAAVRDHVVREWTWERTADRLLDAAS